jgi:16S rRNA (uracil1498-N3)-methyltransferase
VRAIYYPFLKENSYQSIIVTDESAKHLQVVRIKSGEDVLVLNGLGITALTKVGTVSKNQIELLVESLEESSVKHGISLAIANPKKEAFEDILKIAVELGIQEIYPLTSEFSQYEYVPSERIQRILENALIQSNNPFLPTIHPQIELKEFLAIKKTPLYFFNSRPNITEKKSKIEDSINILIGPEGGFSVKEVDLIMASSDVYSIHLPTPILRAPTAVASSVGYLLSLR